MQPNRLTLILLAGLLLSSPVLAAAQQVFIYPSRGQSPQQEQFDKGQCYTWAVQQSSFDPANPQVAEAPVHCSSRGGGSPLSAEDFRPKIWPAGLAGRGPWAAPGHCGPPDGSLKDMQSYTGGRRCCRGECSLV
jgi:hypothetical protein